MRSEIHKHVFHTGFSLSRRSSPVTISTKPSFLEGRVLYPRTRETEKEFSFAWWENPPRKSYGSAEASRKKEKTGTRVPFARIHEVSFRDRLNALKKKKGRMPRPRNGRNRRAVRIDVNDHRPLYVSVSVIRRRDSTTLVSRGIRARCPIFHRTEIYGNGCDDVAGK